MGLKIVDLNEMIRYWVIKKSGGACLPPVPTEDRVGIIGYQVTRILGLGIYEKHPCLASAINTGVGTAFTGFNL